METLLQRSGFTHYEVVRNGATLEAVAATTAEGLASVDREPVLDQRALLAYLDRAADAAPPRTALANGMASRHFRATVMLGDFAAAEKSITRAHDAMLVRRGFDLDEPRACAEALRAGARAAWNLAGEAYSMGILELAGRDTPDRAAKYFELAAQAASSWTEASGTLDLDTWNLRELSLGHLCIAFARCEPAASVLALDRLAEVLDDRLPADAERIAWWKTRTFNELVAHGNPAVEPELVDAVQRSADSLARSPDGEYRRAALDALFLLGIRALNTGSPSVARAWFACCAGACDVVPSTDGHALCLAADARAHDAMAAERGGHAPALVAARADDPEVVVGLDCVLVRRVRSLRAGLRARGLPCDRVRHAPQRRQGVEPAALAPRRRRGNLPGRDRSPELWLRPVRRRPPGRRPAVGARHGGRHAQHPGGAARSPAAAARGPVRFGRARLRPIACRSRPGAGPRARMAGGGGDGPRGAEGEVREPPGLQRRHPPRVERRRCRRRAPAVAFLSRPARFPPPSVPRCSSTSSRRGWSPRS